MPVLTEVARSGPTLVVGATVVVFL
jgi:hypothetical protein